ncbi:MAG: response regulator [Hormoscilla sp.]
MTRILLVDDSATMRKMVKASLKDLGEVSFGEASNGLEAIEELANASYDMIVLDLNMPEMHGLEAIKFIVGHPTYKDIPIVILTTKGDEESKKKALEEGAAKYLTKPFKPQTLSENIVEVLNKFMK